MIARKLGWLRAGMLGIAALGLVIGLAVTPVANAGEGTIKIAQNDWTGQFIDINLAKIILEEEMGYDVELIFADYGAQWQGIANGDLDFTMEIWPDWSIDDHKKYIDEKGLVEVIGPLGVIGSTGWFVPTYVIKGDSERGIEPMAPDLKSWEDLNKYVDLFKRPESGDKGYALDSVPAWQNFNEDRIEHLGLNYVNIYAGTEGAFFAEIEAAYKRGEPILAVNMWEPHWFMGKYDFTEIELPPYSDECWETTHACDWRPAVLYNVARVGFRDEFPDAYQLIANMTLTTAQQQAMLILIDDEGLSVEEGVRLWMGDNEDVWRTWIP